MIFSPLHHQKTALRRTASSALRGLPTQSRDAHSKQICACLENWFNHFPAAQGHPLAVYLALSTEANIDAFIEELLTRDRAPMIVAPRGHADADSSFYPLLSLHAVERGPFGTREPRIFEGVNVVAPESVGAWLVPGLAFDEKGFRLGRGGGWYDRVLSRAAADAVKIGVCFESQIVPLVPCEPHDVRLDTLVTEARIIQTRLTAPSLLPHVSTDPQ